MCGKEGFFSQIKYHIETKPFLHGGVCIFAGTVKIDEVKMHFLPLKFSKKKQTNVQLCPQLHDDRGDGGEGVDERT